MSLKSLKPRIFKFNKGDIWDGDESIIHYLMDKLLTYNPYTKDYKFKVKAKTYVTIMITQDEPKKSSNNEDEKDE